MRLPPIRTTTTTWSRQRDRLIMACLVTSVVLYMSGLVVISRNTPWEEHHRAMKQPGGGGGTHHDQQYRSQKRPRGKIKTTYAPLSPKKMITKNPDLKIHDNSISLSASPNTVRKLSALDLMKKEIIVFQTDSRLHQLWNTNSFPGNFSTHVVAPSVDAMSTWAATHNYGYLFIDAMCTNLKHPTYNADALAMTWCKVPHLLYAHHIAQLVQAKWLLYVDTDVGPQPESITTLEHVISCLAPETQLVASLADAQAWDCEASNTYGKRGPINSGVMLLRVSMETEKLLRRWWYDLPTRRTAFEKKWDHDLVILNRNLVDDVDEVKHAIEELANEMWAAGFVNGTFGMHDPFMLRLLGGDAIWSWCCDMGHCARILSKGMASPSSPFVDQQQNSWIVRCQHARGDTMHQWPGDQDRLNQMFDDEGDVPRTKRMIKAQFPGKCAQDGRYKLDPHATPPMDVISHARGMLAQFEADNEILWETKHYLDYGKFIATYRTKWMVDPPRHPCILAEYSCNDGTTLSYTSFRKESVVFHWTMSGRVNGKAVFSVKESVLLYNSKQRDRKMSFAQWTATEAWIDLKQSLPVIRLRASSGGSNDVVYETLRDIDLGNFDLLGKGNALVVAVQS